MAIWQTIVAVLAAIGMAVMLYFMNYSDHGAPGLKKLDPAFRLPDMRPRYSPDELRTCLDGLGEEGRGRLIGLWHMDYIFIACFWAVMLLVPLNITKVPWLRNVMQIAATLRALLDILENLLLTRCCRRYPAFSARMARVASASTMLKFGMLGVWLAALFGALLIRSLGL